VAQLKVGVKAGCNGERIYRCKVVRSAKLGWKACVQYGGKNIKNYIQYFLHLVLFSLCGVLLTVFILRVLLSSYVYLLYLIMYTIIQN